MNAKLARIKKGLTQENVRKLLKEKFSIGVSPCTIVAIEKGNFNGIRYELMIAYAKLLDSTVEELFFSDEQ